MDKIYLPHLAQKPDHAMGFTFNQFIDDLETLTPVKGEIKVVHKGNFLEVFGKAEAITTMTCDRCLQQYNQRLKLNKSEIIWLDPEANQPYSGPNELETTVDDLVETLPPDGHFEPMVWLYEHLCLCMPLRKLCSSSCEGIITLVDGEESSESPTIDHRWGVLKSVRQKLEE
jgi:uncharacterized protein